MPKPSQGDIMKESRWPRVGDLIIHNCRHTGDRHSGLIYRIGDDRRTGEVMIEWIDGESPIYYTETYGYSALNMHNCRDEFTIIRNGRSVV